MAKSSAMKSVERKKKGENEDGEKGEKRNRTNWWKEQGFDRFLKER